MSEIITDTITGKSTATTITIGSTPVVSSSANSMTIRGEGSNQTSIQQGLAKAWCHFNGSGTIATQDSFNIASLTDRGTGLYTVLFTNDMGNANHCSAGSVKKDDANDDGNIMTQIGGHNNYTTVAGEIRVITRRVQQTLTGVNATEIQTITHGDLA